MVSPPNPVRTVLICDDEESFSLALRFQLKKWNYQVLSAKNGDEALAIIRNRKIDAVLLDIQMRSDREGLDLLPKLKELDADLAVIMLSGLKDFSIVREAMRLGACDYIAKDADPSEMEIVLQRALEKQSLLVRRDQQSAESKTLHRKHSFVGSNPRIELLKRMIEKVKVSPAHVLIHAETGCGKEVIARLLRRETDDGGLEPFVAVDSATIHSQTAESILFGHEKGAFTGADKPRKGIFEEANGGLVYFDEIGNMSLEIQAKLLRVIQEKEVTRLGSARAIPLDFRVVAATNKDLEQMVKAGLFKDDLLQRLNVIPLSIPPLRDRTDDIPVLIQHFLTELRAHLEFSDKAMQVMNRYNWPGNVRELQNLVLYLVTLASSDFISVEDLPVKIKAARVLDVNPSSTLDQGGSFYERVAQYERQMLESALKGAAHGNMTQLARDLGMDRSHLYSKLKAYGLSAKDQSATA